MGQEDHELAPRPNEVALGGLAAFFAQPADEDEPTVGGLAAFYAQPDEDDEPLPTLTSTWAVLDQLFGGRIVALVVDVGQQYPTVVQVSR